MNTPDQEKDLRTRGDKRYAVGLFLNSEESSRWSDREIARQCNVGKSLVGQMRKETTPPPDTRKGLEFNVTRIINETCDTLSGCAMSIGFIKGAQFKITPEEAQDYIDDISTAIKQVNWLRRELRGIANEQP